MRLPCAALLCAAACAGPPRASGRADERYVAALREEHRALGHAQAVLAWTEATRGSAPPVESAPAAVFTPVALEALQEAAAQPGRDPSDALALRFLRRALDGERLGLALAPFDRALAAAERGARVTVAGSTLSLRELPAAIAAEPDAERRERLDAALVALDESALGPLLARREAAAQQAARAAGFRDYAALSEELRGVRLRALLEDGVRYVEATEAVFLPLLDRVAREELGLGREQLRLADLGRLWTAPRLAADFEPALELKALQHFLSGVGLDLRTAAGTEVLIDDAARPGKRPRAFVEPVDAPADVRLSIQPGGGLAGYWTLFHEAGHAVHFANATAAPRELLTLGHGAPSEAFGELFRAAFADPRFLRRYRAFLVAEGRPAPRDAELAAVLRRTALLELLQLRRHAFARIAFELRLHGRPAEELEPALLLLRARGLRSEPERAGPATDAELRALYQQLFGVACGFRVTASEAGRFRAETDDTFAAADYARAFALGGALHEALQRRFGPDWSGDARVGAFLRAQLFAPGEALSAEDVLARLGEEPRVDFGQAARRAARLVAEADALEMGAVAWRLK